MKFIDYIVWVYFDDLITKYKYINYYIYFII